MPVTPSAPLSSGAQPGAELTPGRQWQAVLSQAVDGRPLLSGDGIQLALPAWPPGAAELSPGTVLKVLVLATQPRLQLSLQLERQGAEPEGETPARAWQLEQAAMPRLAKPLPAAAELAQAWRQALLGRLTQAAAQFQQAGGSHLPGALLQQLPELALAGVRNAAGEPPLPLTLPFWLWGGPALTLSVEDALEREPESEQDDLDLVLWLTAPGIGAFCLRVRSVADGVALAFAAPAEACVALRQRLPGIVEAVVRGGGKLRGCLIGERMPWRGLAISRHGATGLQAQRLSPLLFAVAAEVAGQLLAEPGGAAAPARGSGGL